MSQTVRIDWKHILPWVRVSVRPSKFLYAKSPKTSGKPGRQRECLLEWTSDRTLIASGTREKGRNSVTVGRHRYIEQRPPERRRRCVCARVRVCDVFSINDNNIWPRLIMIIIKSIQHCNAHIIDWISNAKMSRNGVIRSRLFDYIYQ